MDISEYLNSKDIKEYVRKIGYKFSPEEALYVIHRSRKATLAEKREAFKELLSQYPDYRLRERRFNSFKNHTLKSFLQALFQRQDALIAECKHNGDNAVYFMHTYDSREGWNRDINKLFSTFDECFSAAKEDEYAEKVEIVKQYLAYNRTISLTVLPDGTILDIETSERDDEVMDAFDMMYVEIPTPFRFGDIVTSVREKVWDSTHSEPYEDVVVITDIVNWDRDTASGCDLRETWGSLDNYFAYEKLRKRHLESGDETDMTYAGYYVTEGGIICDHSVEDTYLDLEYYSGELSGRGRILRAISLYFQKMLNLETLLAAIKTIEAEETKRKLWESCLCGREEDMKKIGIKKDVIG